MEKAIDKQTMLNLIIDAKRTDPETGSFADWLAEYLVEYLSTLSQSSNNPLTLDELREMDGKPVYIPETNCWALVAKNPFVPLFTWPDGEQCSAYDWYEQVGQVYRRPPEGKENT